jgi:membrane protease YdiL (CAAX protease family)
MRQPELTPVESAPPTRWPGAFLLEALIVAFIFWADIHRWRHVVIFSKTPYLLVLGWISLRVRNMTWRQLGMAAPTNWPRTLFTGLIAGCGMEALELFITQPVLVHLFHQPPDLSALAELHHHPGMLALALALTWTVAAFGEELVWRGYVLNRIAEVLGSIGSRFAIAVILSSAAFGLAHYDQGITGVTENIIDGAILALLYLASGRNLWVPILAHGITDTVDCILLYSGHYPMW